MEVLRGGQSACLSREGVALREIWTGPSPLLARRGGCASKKKVRSIRSGADGVVVQVQKHFRLILNHHPVRSIKGGFAIFPLDVASTPGQEGRCPVRQVCH